MSNQVGDNFKFLWPSQKSWTLIGMYLHSENSIDKVIWIKCQKTINATPWYHHNSICSSEFANHFSELSLVGVLGGALAPPDFRSSVNPVPNRGDRLCPPDYC